MEDSDDDITGKYAAANRFAKDLAVALLRITMESYTKRAVYYRDTGQVVECQEVALSNHLLADERLMKAFFGRLGLRPSVCRGASRAFGRMAKLRRRALKAAQRDPAARLDAIHNRDRINVAHIQLKGLCEGPRGKGLRVAARHLGVDTTEIDERRHGDGVWGYDQKLDQALTAWIKEHGVQ